MKLLKAFCVLACLITFQSHATNIPKLVKTRFDQNTLLGYWVGMLVPDKEVTPGTAGQLNVFDFRNKINISIDKISGGKVTGHTVVAGNIRQFAGAIVKQGDTFAFSVKEQGDNSDDGIFEFSVDANNTVLTGTWKANNADLAIPARKYELVKRTFRYDPEDKLVTGWRVSYWRKPGETNKDDLDPSYFATTNDVYLYNASAALLSKDVVANLKKGDIFILRNSIYARHGYSFKSQQLRNYFDRQPWYVPVSVNVDKDLTDIEKANVDMLLRYEKNAKAYYNKFAR